MVYQSSCRIRGFSLVEMMVAIVVLSILFIMMTQLFTESVLTINGSGRHLTADGQARLIFSRIGDDISGMVKRNDVDTIFFKPELNGGGGGGGNNDSLFLYSQAPSYLSDADTINSSSVALLGYRINNSTSDPHYQQLERLGQGLTWGSSTTPGIVYLTWNPSASSSSSTGGFYSQSVLSNWSSIGTAPYTSQSSTLSQAGNYTTPYEVLGDQVFRFEVCYLLKDGTYSDYPVLSNSLTGWNSTYTFFTKSNTYPSPTSDQASGFTAGSRWYNTSTGEPFICTNSTSTSAVWSGTGVQDVSAIIVTLAILDNSSRKIISQNLTTDLATLSSDLADSKLPFPAQSTAPTLPAATWNNYISSNMTSMGVPPAVASQIRVYQRYFYINPQSTAQ